MIALIAQLTKIIEMSRLNDERRFLIDTLQCEFYRTLLPTTKFLTTKFLVIVLIDNRIWTGKS